MGIDHRHLHTAVSQQFLHGADVIAVLQQVGGKTVAVGMTTCMFGNAGSTNRLFNRLLQKTLVLVMAKNFTGARINRSIGTREEILPPLLFPAWGYLTARASGSEAV